MEPVIANHPSVPVLVINDWFGLVSSDPFLSSGYCCSSVPYEEHAFISYFVVNEKYRGKGVGGKLLSQTLKALGNRNVSLYSTLDALNFYKKKGGFRSNEPSLTYYASRFVPRIMGNFLFYFVIALVAQVIGTGFAKKSRNWSFLLHENMAHLLFSSQTY